VAWSGAVSTHSDPAFTDLSVNPRFHSASDDQGVELVVSDAAPARDRGTAPSEPLASVGVAAPVAFPTCTGCAGPPPPSDAGERPTVSRTAMSTHGRPLLMAAGGSVAVSRSGAPTMPLPPTRPLTPPVPLAPPAPVAPTAGNPTPGCPTGNGDSGHSDGDLAVLAAHEAAVLSLARTRIASTVHNRVVGPAGDARGRPD
jgi:hypothetical protein